MQLNFKGEGASLVFLNYSILRKAINLLIEAKGRYDNSP